MQVDSVKKTKRDMFIFCHNSRGDKYKMVSDLSVFECWLINTGRMIKPIGYYCFETKTYQILIQPLMSWEYWRQPNDVIYYDIQDFMYEFHIQPSYSDTPVFYNKSLAISISIIFGIMGIAYYIYTLIK